MAPGFLALCYKKAFGAVDLRPSSASWIYASLTNWYRFNSLGQADNASFFLAHQ